MTITIGTVQGLPYVCLILLHRLGTAYALIRLVKPFMENIKSAVCTGTVYVSMMLLLGLIPLKIGTLTAHCLGAAAAFAVMCAADRRNYRQKAFLSLLFLAVVRLALALADILYDFAYAEAVYIPFFSQRDDEVLWTVLYILMCVFYLFAEISILLAGTWLITREYVRKSEELTVKELFMLSAFPLIGIGGDFVMNHYRTFYIIKEGAMSAKTDAVAVFFYLALLAGMLVSLVLYQGIKAEQEDRLQDRLLAGQVEDMRRHITRVEEIYEGIRGLKHDMAGHIATLEKLYAGTETKEADAYAARLRTSLADVAGTIRSGNPVTDVVLWEQKAEAEKKGIRFQCDFHYPAGSGMEAFDMSIILNNALSNAVEHADARDGEEAYISLCSYRRNNACMIEVRNSFSGSVRIEADTGLIHTSKKQGLHGYGLENIRRTAEKYHGDIDITQGEGEFCLTVMLMME